MTDGSSSVAARRKDTAMHDAATTVAKMRRVWLYVTSNPPYSMSHFVSGQLAPSFP
jgi:hypothetical protein